jgi:alkylation response protein AidB-like acyl-CoA dehydrogenase
MQPRVSRHGDDRMLDGAKTFITNGTVAGAVLTFARTNESGIIRRHLSGVDTMQ